MGAKRSSTIGYEKLYNSALQVKNKSKFIESLTTNMPEAPDHFSRCSAMNAKGPALVRKLPVPMAMDPTMFHKRWQRKNTLILDVRKYEAFGGQHIPGAYHIDVGGNFATFAGWVLPLKTDILLVTEGAQQAEEAVVWLRRVGLDRTVGYLDGGMFAWAKAALPLEHVQQLSAQELHNRIKKGGTLTIVDARAAREYESTHIEGAVNIPAPDLRKRYRELEPETPIVVMCSTGHRSSLGTSLLKQHGFKEVFNAAGGMTAYSAADYAPECPMCVIPHGPDFMVRKM
jgi:rhodanese-related sulfurtransferase